ncbi:hypothetical protein SAMN05421820_11571 [Pedobacter steynii]|uniref:Aspartyl protease n=1 Tax=Pedobacter steynii TaxID=430522 RepID=A0A1H0JTY2_9SPHI|nr:hypothetical protein [Pedobacter steynii]NQX43158.1 hypothetical protein [Pedobacter steynii]SDO47003.1 hypothetical protein SAMN05421820_11571 [Pedobacter steynii]
MQIKPNFFKKFLSVILGSTIFSIKLIMAQSMPTLPVNQLVMSSETKTISFRWHGDYINSKWEANTAILIPVKLKNCPRLFYMQFDLGSPYSLLYKNKVEAIQMKYPKSIPLREVGDKLQNFSFNVAEISILAKEIIVQQFDSTSIDWKDKNSTEIIGTIGADLIDNKVVIIDYANCKLTISKSIPEKLLGHISLTNFIYSNRSVLFPAKLKGKETILYFDTGSSMFELLTNKEMCSQLAKTNAELIQYKVKSWSKLLTANTLASNDSLEFAGTTIPLRSSTYIEGISNTQIEQMSKMGIHGMIGNKLFLNYILVIDTKNQKFGIASSF